ncbi:hypothetical protein VTL71DRAFT_11213 [Oculimacula yallundae]|uniref:Uncharacterized protein n=1 Tax=Oculimacula yallundae TaxID=86028 RepID=A0ABR4CVM7_9HELO
MQDIQDMQHAEVMAAFSSLASSLNSLRALQIQREDISHEIQETARQRMENDLYQVETERQEEVRRRQRLWIAVFLAAYTAWTIWSCLKVRRRKVGNSRTTT